MVKMISQVYTCSTKQSNLGMESQARDKTSHAASEAASISPQCGIHLLKKEGELLDLKFFLANWQQPPDLDTNTMSFLLSQSFAHIF